MQYTYFMDSLELSRDKIAELIRLHRKENYSHIQDGILHIAPRLEGDGGDSWKNELIIFQRGFESFESEKIRNEKSWLTLTIAGIILRGGKLLYGKDLDDIDLPQLKFSQYEDKLRLTSEIEKLTQDWRWEFGINLDLPQNGIEYVYKWEWIIENDDKTYEDGRLTIFLTRIASNYALFVQYHYND